MKNQKNLVVLAPEAVYPPNTGGRIVVFNKIKYLSKLGYKITLFCIVDSDEEGRIQNKNLEKMGIKSHFYNRKKHKLHSLFGAIRLPYAVASRNNIHLQKDLTGLIREKKVDIIDVEFPQMMINIINLKLIYLHNIKIILNQHNIEYLSMRSISNSFRNPIKHFIFKTDAIRMRKYENSVYNSKIISGYTFVSKKDLQIFKDEHRNINVPLKTFGIGAEEHPNFQKKLSSKDVIIVGKMSYQPNIEGALWFIKNVFPKVRKACPKSKLYIVGKDPVEKLTNISGNRIIVTGTVNSVEPYYAKSKVVAIPIFSGGGVKTKLIEAASYGLPIITTSSGVAGTDFKNNKQVIVTSNVNNFAKYIIDAINDQPYMQKLANNAHHLFLREYTWVTICKQLDRFFISLV